MFYTLLLTYHENRHKTSNIINKLQNYKKHFRFLCIRGVQTPVLNPYLFAREQPKTIFLAIFLALNNYASKFKSWRPDDDFS